MKGLIFVFVLLGGCATMTEDQRYDRETASIVAMEEFQAKTKACKQANGYMIVHLPAATRIKRKVSRFDYVTARCVNR